MKIESITTTILNDQYNWIESNYKALETSYINLEHDKVKNLPFALYCIAMYAKHKQLVN